jgi:serpin B
MFIVLTMLITGCSKDDNNEPSVLDPVDIELNAKQLVVVESSNNFAFDIFSRVNSADEAGKNFMISPLSISYALSMTLNGADGETLTAMKSTLGMADMSVDDINSSFSGITDALLGVDDKVDINIANSVWVYEGFYVLPGFIQRLGDYYDAETGEFTISQASIDEINGWIEEETNGMIKEMLKELSADIRLLLVNAICFEGEWYSGFDADNTSDKPFYKTDGNSVEVPMMAQTEDFKLYRGEDFAMLELPYGRGNYVMDIVLPDNNDGIENLTSNLTGENFKRWADQASEYEVNVLLPRFKYEYEKQLNDILIDMGMGVAFNYAEADFSGIDGKRDLFIGFVQHNSFIETDEKGTKAAAATIVGMYTTAMPIEPQPYTFNADHPFLYVIREVTTNTIVFMGKVEDPS